MSTLQSDFVFSFIIFVFSLVVFRQFFFLFIQTTIYDSSIWGAIFDSITMLVRKTGRSSNIALECEMCVEDIDYEFGGLAKWQRHCTSLTDIHYSGMTKHHHYSFHFFFVCFSDSMFVCVLSFTLISLGLKRFSLLLYDSRIDFGNSFYHFE